MASPKGSSQSYFGDLSFNFLFLRHSLVIVAVYLFLFATLSLFYPGYYLFNMGSDTNDQLPLILRALDLAYLPHDFYVREMSGFGFRSIYVQWMALWVSWLGLEWAHLFMYWLSSLMVGTFGYLIARRIFFAQPASALLVSFVFVFVPTFEIGGLPAFVSGYQTPVPMTLAVSLSLGVLLLFLLQKELWAVLAAGALSFLHPHIGLFVALYGTLASMLTNPRSLKGASTFVGLIILILFWANQRVGGSLVLPEFMQIIAQFRAPHHFLPSRFPIKDWLHLLILVVAYGFGFYLWRKRHHPARKKQEFVFLFALFVLLGALAGYFFVEVWPTRTILVSLPFRQMYLLYVFAVLFFASLLNWQKVPRWPIGIFASLAIVCGLGQKEWFSAINWPWLDHRLIFNLENEKQRTQDKEDVEALDLLTLGEIANQKLPDEAIVLVPPKWSMFRLASSRALLVDAKATPFANPANWYQRMRDAYGVEPEKVGDNYWKYIFELQLTAYHEMEEKHLRDLHERYGVTHAVVFRETVMSFPAIAHGEEFKLIEIR